jgi:hypothetical protein
MQSLEYSDEAISVNFTFAITSVILILAYDFSIVCHFHKLIFSTVILPTVVCYKFYLDKFFYIIYFKLTRTVMEVIQNS